MSIVARDRDRLAAARRHLGGSVTTAAADVTDASALQTAFEALVAVHGPCDILVTAAGRAEPGYLLDLGPEVFRRQMDVNYLGTVHAARAALPDMVARGRGHLVLVSSVSGLLGVFGYGAYTPTKFAVRGLGEAIDSEFHTRGIVTSIVFPPDTDTPGFQRENLGKPPETVRVAGGERPVSAERVATSIVRGIERNRRHITVEWQSRLISRLGEIHGPVLRTVMRRRLRS